MWSLAVLLRLFYINTLYVLCFHLTCVSKVNDDDENHANFTETCGSDYKILIGQEMWFVQAV